MGWFAAGFLCVALLRADLPSFGMAAVVAVAAAVLFTLRGALRTAFAARGGHGAALALGAALACAVPASVPRSAAPRAERLDARPKPARARGVVASTAASRNGEARFRLAGGFTVRVRGAEFAPLPGSFVDAVGRLDAEGGSMTVADPSGIETRPPPPFHVLASVEVMRRRLLDRLRRSTPTRAADVLGAVLFAEPTLPPKLRADLARTGTLHLVAVSGSHLSLVLAGLRCATPRLRVLLPLLGLYAALTGFAPPVLRSLVLAVGTALGRRSGGRTEPFGHLLFSATVVLSFDPAALYDAGFQLSFAAFFGLSCAGPGPADEDPFAAARKARDGGGGEFRRRLELGLRTSLAASLMAAPTTLVRFRQIAWAGPFATILLAPFIAPLLVLGALCIAFPDTPAPGLIAEGLVVAMSAAVGAVAQIPGAAVYVARPFPAAAGLLSGAAVVFCLRLRTGSAGRREVALLLITLAACLVPDRAAPGLYVLDAGRGSAALLLDRDAAVLVDAGPPEARVAEKILDLGVEKLDALVVTHGHADHVGGIDDVRMKLKVGDLLAPPSDARRLGPEWRAVRRGDRYAARGVACRFLWPDGRSPLRNPNDRSLVVAARIGALSAWIPGDLETEGLRRLSAADALEPVDVLVLPHHGSENDAMADLLLALRPRGAAISARAGFPAEATLRLLEAAGVPTRATYVEGTIFAPAESPPR